MVNTYPARMALGMRRVLIVEDEPLMASLLADSLRGSGFEVDTAGDVSQARRKIEDFDPDMLLLDISLGDGPTGVHLAHAVQLTRPDIAMLFLTRHPDAVSANREGLDLPKNVGFLRKHLVNDQGYLIDAIEKVFAERPNEVRQDSAPQPTFAGLSEHSLLVLRLIAEGCNNAQIANRCDASTKSVERWIDRLYKELGIDTKGDLNPRVEAARRYFMAVGIPHSSGR